jgi:HEAT repeat protein
MDALSSIKSDTAIPALIEIFSADSGKEFRMAAAQALAHYGAAAKRAVPALIEGLKEEAEIAEYASYTLGWIGANAVPALSDFLRKSNPTKNQRQLAVKALDFMGPKAEAAVPLLAPLLNDKDDEYLRLTAISALGRIGAPAQAAVPALTQTLEDDSAIVRLRAAVALFQINPRNHQTVPVLAKCLQDEHDQIRWHAAHELSYLGPSAASAVADLVRALDDTHNSVRSEAALALGRIGKAATRAIPALERVATRDPYDSVRYAALRAVARIDRATR